MPSFIAYGWVWWPTLWPKIGPDCTVLKKGGLSRAESEKGSSEEAFDSQGQGSKTGGVTEC